MKGKLIEIVKTWGEWYPGEQSKVIEVIEDVIGGNYIGIYYRLQTDFVHDWSVVPANCVKQVL